MASSYVEHVGDGTTTAFAVPFPYIATTHVGALVSDVVTAFTWLTSSSVSITPAPALGATVRIARATPNTLLVTFTGGNLLDKESLNLLARQALYRSIEAEEAQPLPAMPAPENRVSTLFSYDEAGAFELRPIPSIFAVDGVTLAELPDASVSTTKLADNAVTNVKMADLSVGTAELIADAVTNAKLADLAVQTENVAAKAITYAKVQDVSATQRVLGRDTAGAGVIEELTPTVLTAMLNVMVAGGAKGLVPATVAGDVSKALFGDGTFKSVPGYIGRHTAANSTSLDVTGMTAGLYLLGLNNLRPATSGDDPSFRFSSAASFLTGANYGYQQNAAATATNGAAGTGSSINGTTIQVHNDQATSQISALRGIAFMFVGGAVTAATHIVGLTSHYNSATGALLSVFFSGHYNSAAQMDGVRFFYPAGNITDGSIDVVKVL